MLTTDKAAALRVRTYKRGEVLYTVTSGDFTLESAQSTFLVVLDEVRLQHITKVLMDGRSVKGEPSIIERFFYGEFAAAESARDGVPGGVMFAYVLNEPVLDPMRLGETVAINRGMNIKVFDDYEMALQWLRVAAPNHE